MFNKIRIKMWKIKCSRNVLNNNTKKPDMSQNKTMKRKEINITLDKMDFKKIETQ